MNKKRDFLKNQIYKIVINKIINIIFITSVILGMLLYVLRIIYRQQTYKNYDFPYIWANFIERNIIFILLVLWCFDIIIVLSLEFRKLIAHIVMVSNASKKIIEDTNEWIEFPDILKDVEWEMNQLKQEALRNAQIAKETEQRKNDLIIYLAHDLKTPLTSVIGYLTLLRDEQEISKELREKYLSISLDRAERLEDLMNEFFEIARFNLTQLTLELSRINLSRFLEQILYEFQPLLDEKNLTYDFHMPSGLEIKCDTAKMQRVFDNLVRNAISYSFSKSVIDIYVTENENNVQIRFINSGNTIPEEKLTRIFEQFYRLDISRTTKTGGAGLGLAIAKEIIELHGGSIEVHSEDEKIEFVIYLPK